VAAVPSNDPDDARAKAVQQAAEAAAIMQKFTFLQHLQRSPAAVLRLKAQQAAGLEKDKAADHAAKTESGKNPAPDADKLVSDEFVAGDWKAIGKYLATLPKDQGPKVYTTMLAMMVGGKNLLSPDDVLALADASPADLEDQQFTLLGQLLQRSRADLGVPRAALLHLKAGTERMGGSDPAKRLAAARFLSEAGMIDAAQSYLPPLEYVLKSKDPRILNLVANCKLKAAVTGDDKIALRAAWDLTNLVIAMPSVANAAQSEAIDRALQLAAIMPEKDVSQWIKKLALENRLLCMTILAQSSQYAEDTFRARAIEPRAQAIAAQHRLGTALLDLPVKDREAWAETIRVLSLGWLNEATYAVNFESELEESDRAAGVGGRDPLAGLSDLARLITSFQGGSASSSSLSSSSRMRRDRGGNNEPAPMDAGVLLATSPGDAWCRSVDPDLSRQLRRLTAIVTAEGNDRALTFAAIRASLKDDPKLARELAERYFNNWVTTLQGARSSSGEQSICYSGGHRSVFNNSQGGSSGGVPLIRAIQVRNLAALHDELKAVGELGTLPLHEQLLASAFDACHSPAEIYREEDIAQVFGNIDSMPPALAMQLASTMRTKLVSQWAKPETQTDAGTQRTDKDLVAEILRGYGLAKKIAAAAEKQAPQVPQIVMLEATLCFDEAEFQYGQKADLKTYAGLRDSAFAAYRKAGELYAKAAPQLPKAGQSADVYMRWFQSALGASDLAYLTRQDKPDADQIEHIAAAIHSLGGETADRHMEMFAQNVTSSMSEVPGNLKVHYLESAMRVLGDHPAGKAARDRLKFYDELLGEVQVHAEVDGDAKVGHGNPFGVRLSIRYTAALGRESNFFLSLLQKSNVGGREIDQPKIIEATIGEKLSQTFDVVMVRFHDLRTTPHGFGRPGWMETPLAYVVLQAKTPSVDRIPIIPIDLEFNDGSGSVLLPVASQVVLLDARDEQPPARPYKDLKIRQIWDDRRLASGSAQLEVLATAQGLIPPLDRLVDLSSSTMPGFHVIKVQDQRLEVKSLGTDGAETFPVTERRWTVEVSPDADAKTPPSQFAFPAAKAPVAAMEYQRYEDADVASVGPTIPLHLAASPRQISLWAGAVAAIVLALAIAIAIVLYAVRRRRTAAAGPRYRRPEPLTPFNAVVLLKRIQSDRALAISETERRALGETIADMEYRYFHRAAAPSARKDIVDDLSPVLDRWLKMAG
jgi:hypothetical protein